MLNRDSIMDDAAAALRSEGVHSPVDAHGKLYGQGVVHTVK